MRILHIAVLLVAFWINAFAQEGTIKGLIKDAETKEPMIGVNIVSENGIGTVTDLDGKYELKLEAGNRQIEYKFIGYSVINKKVKVDAGQTVVQDINMFQESLNLGLVVVSSSKYEKKIDEEIVSMEVMKQDFVENYNAVTADKALARIPGVNLVGEQINIRGGSGYSGGAGSRVLMLLDGLPYLAAQSGAADLNSLPMENLEQIEVIKGAASSMYGSSALNGLINVRTAWPKAEPYSKLTMFFGTYSNPHAKGKKHLVWWENRPMFGGMNFAHRKKFKNFDFVVGGSYSEDQGYLFASDVRRVRGLIKTRWRPEKVENLTLGLNANLSSTGGSFFFLWNDFGDTIGRVVPNSKKTLVDEKCQCLDSLAYVPKEVLTATTIPIVLDPYITYFDKKNNMHSLKGRYFFIRQRQSNGEDTDAGSIYGEYTFHSSLKKLGLDFVTGASVTHSYITSKITGTPKSENAAVFLQVDKKFWDRLSLTFGGRFEYIKLDTLKSFYKPIFRGGFNIQAAEGTYIRASAGQGFRYPSVSEVFTTTIRNGIKVIPNPDLREETGWSAELGIKQAFKVSNWYGYLDVAGFLSRYYDMIDFAFANTGEFAFQAQNLLDTAQIAGFEVSTIAQGKLFGIPFNFLVGYTYIDPRELTVAAKSDTVRKNILDYRSKHTAKGDISATYQKVSLGFTGTYASFVTNLDPNIASLSGIREFRNVHSKGQAIFDIRIGYDISKNFKLMLLAKNIMNTQYMIRPAFIEQPRNYTVQLSYDF
jgi:iron complex outermembrane receptor protein